MMPELLEEKKQMEEIFIVADSPSMRAKADEFYRNIYFISDALLDIRSVDRFGHPNACMGARYTQDTQHVLTIVGFDARSPVFRNGFEKKMSFFIEPDGQNLLKKPTRFSLLHLPLFTRKYIETCDLNAKERKIPIGKLKVEDMTPIQKKIAKHLPDPWEEEHD